MVAIFTGSGTGFERGSGSILGGMGLLGGSGLGRGGEQLFFNAANGNLMISRQDEFLVGRGPDVAIARTYNSLGDLSDENGDNWRQSTDRRVYGLTGTIGAAGSTVKRVSADGSEITYTWDGAKNAYIATDGSGAYDKLTHNNGIWTWTDGGSQTTEKYATVGSVWRIVEQADTDGNKLTFTYSGTNLSQITNADGSYVQYAWTGNNITQINTFATAGATPTLTRTRYGYDSLNRLSTVTVDLSPEDKSIADGKAYTTTYGYDGTSRRVSSIAQTDGSRVDISYDGSGRVASITQTASAGVIRTVTIGYQAGFTTVTDPTGQVTRLDYNADGSLKAITSPPAQPGAAQQIVQFAYTATGDVQSVTDALGNPTSYVYDGWGNVLTTTDPLGNVVTRTYGARNELLTETRTGSDQGSAAAAHTTRYVYDSENHLRYLVSAEGRVTEYRYTPDGLLDRTIEYPEHTFNLSAPAPVPPPPPSAGPGPVSVEGYVASFESPDLGNGNLYNPTTIPGMTFSGRTGIISYGTVWGFAFPPDGDQMAFVQSAGSISQALTGMTAGTNYTVKFSIASRPTYGSIPITVSFNGTSLGTFSPASTAFQEITVNFTATGSTGTLTFAGGTAPSDETTAIDNIRITQTPPVYSASFETPEMGTGWQYGATIGGMTFTGRAGLAGNGSALNFAAAPDGDQVAFVQDYQGETGSIAQTVNGLSVGANYNLKFMMAAHSGVGGTQVKVLLNGVSLGTFTPTSTAFQEFSVGFTATGGSATLTFVTTGVAVNGVTAIDNIRVMAIPAVYSASFESPDLGNGNIYNPTVPGMTFSGRTGIISYGTVWGFAYPPDGDQMAFVQSAGSISHALTGLTAGTNYSVKFSIASRPTYGSIPITVSFNGTSLGTFSPASTAFQEIVVNFTATGSTGTLTFAGGTAPSDETTVIDNIRIYPNSTIFDMSFENPDLGNNGGSYVYRPTISGVTFTGGGGVAANGSAFGFYPAPSGDQTAYIQSGPTFGGTISQTMSGLTAGVTYTLKFVLAKRPSYGPTPITVTVDSTSLGTFTPSSDAFVPYTLSFTAVASTATLTFTGAATPSGDCATAIDAISVFNPGIVVASDSFEALEMGNGYQYNPNIRFSGASGLTGNYSAWGFAPAPDGDQVAFIQSDTPGAGTVSQTVSGLTVGAWYDFKFQLASRPGYGATPITVMLGSTSLGTFVPPSTAFSEYSVRFQATGSSALLNFVGAATPTNRATAIDAVRTVLVQGAPATPIASASFEAPEVGNSWVFNPTVPGMTFSANSGINGNGSSIGFAPSTVATDGDQFAFLVNSGTISQSLTGLTAGSTYNVKFFIAAPPSPQYSSVTPVTVSFNGTSLGTFTPSSTVFQEVSVSFTATGTTGTLTFTAGAWVTGMGASAIDNVRIFLAADAAPLPAPWPAESDMDAWRNAIADRSSTKVTVNAYDLRGNLASVTSYGAATAAGDPSTAEGFSRTVFAYDQAGQLLSRSDDGQRSEIFVYDGLGRVTSSTDLNGGVTNVLFDDFNSRTIVTLANGLIKTSTYNLAGDLINYVESHGPAAGPVVWSSSFETPEVQNGYWYNPPIPGMTFFSGAGIEGNGSTLHNFGPAPDGDQVAFVNGFNSSISQTVTGLTAGTTYVLKFFLAWSPNLLQTDVVVSFDGVTLGTYRPSSATFQEFTVNFTAAASTGTLKFTGTSTGSGNAVTAIDGIRVAAIVPGSTNYVYDRRGKLRMVTDATGNKSYFLYDAVGRKIADVNHLGDLIEYRYDANDRLVATARYTNRLTAAQLASLADPANELFNPSFSGTSGWAVTYNPNGIAGAPFTGTTNGKNYLKANVNATAAGQVASLGVAWGNRVNVSAGETLSVSAGVEALGVVGSLNLVVHFFDAADNYVSGTSIGILNGNQPFDTKVAGGVTVPTGAVRAMLELYATSSGAGSGSFSLIGPELKKAASFASLRPAAAATDLWTWQVYDKDGRVVEAIEGDGSVTAYEYDKSDRLVRTTAYVNKLSTAQLDGFKTTQPTTQVLPTANAAKDSVARNFYDKDGLLIGAVDGEGFFSQISYDKAGQKIQETSFLLPTRDDLRAAGTFDQLVTAQGVSPAADRRMRYVYDGQGQLRYTIDGLDQVVELVYNTAGKAVSTVQYAGSIAATNDWTFDNIKALVASSGLAANAATRRSWSVYDDSGRLAYSIDAEGGVTGMSYDAMGQVTKTVQYAAVRPTSSLPTKADMDSWIAGQATNAANRTTRFFYDERGELRFTVDAEGLVSGSEYDSEGRVIRTIRWSTAVSVTDSTSLSTLNGLSKGAYSDSVMVYDSAGRLSDVFDAEGNRRHLDYNANGTVAFDTAAYGSPDETKTRFVYDNAGRVTEQYLAYGTPEQGLTRYAYDGLGNLVTITDPNNNVTSRVYDRLGQMVSVTNAENATVTFQYDAFGATVKATDPLGNATYNYYDKLGRLTTVRDAEDFVTETAYDVFGDVASVTRRANRTTSAASVTVAPSVTASSLDTTARFYYDRLGRQTIARDAESYLTETAYDAFGGVVSVTRRANRTTSATNVTPSAVASAQDATTRFFYDRLGRQKAVRDAEGYLTETTYNALGKVTSVTRRAARDNLLVNGSFETTDASAVATPWGKSSATVPGWTKVNSQNGEFVDSGIEAVVATDGKYWLDLDSNAGAGSNMEIYQIVNGLAAGQTLTLQFDHANRTSAASGAFEVYWNGVLVASISETGTTMRTKSYTLTAIAGANKLTFKGVGTEDGWGASLDNVRLTSDAQPSVQPNAQDATTRFEYDRRGLLVKMVDARGFSEQYALDALGRQVSVSDKLGGKTNYVYNRRGLITDRTRVISTSRWMSDQTSLSSSVTTRFEYDANGNRTKMIEASGLPEQRTTTYVYDKANRLTETRGDVIQLLSQTSFSSYTAVTPTSRIKYDANGNVIETVDAIGIDAAGNVAAPGIRTLFYYDKLNRETKELNAVGLLTAFDYDANGNVTASRAYATAVALPATAGGIPPAVPAGDYRETVYEYDKLSRMLSSTINGVRVGKWDAQYSTWIGTVRASYQYDANGNVIRTFDSNNNMVFSYYDRLGRKTDQVDRANYLTHWTYDAEGNAVSEIRFANAAAGLVTTDSVPAVVADAANDRVTTFTYDKNGNRLTETRKGVVAYTVDANGVLAAAPTTATISYLYDGLGHVMRKTEATGQSTDYVYDTAGRLITELRPGYTDQTGAAVRPTIDYFYNGLDLLTKTRQGGPTPNASDRISQNAYGAGGRLAQTTDAAGAICSYDYDTAGNLVREFYGRLKSDGSVVNEAILYTRDVLGRKTSQTLATWNGTAYDKGDIQTIHYDLFGEVDRRGLNVSPELGQEQFDYDKAGRLWRTNSGDGVWRYFILDGNGNQTLAIESEGTDLANKSIDDVLTIVGAATPGSTYVDGVNLTINVYDKRDLAIETRLPNRQLNGSQTTTATTVTLVVDRGYTAFGEVAWETDAAGSRTDLTYNTLGRVTQIRQPGVSITTDTGTSLTVQPTEKFYYDVSGRLIGRDDANGNRTTRALLAGSGYGGRDEVTTAEFHADTGVIRTFYDVFGDARILRNELYDPLLNNTNVSDETRSYDAMGRIITQVHRGGLIESFRYDHLGQRIKHWNSLLGDFNVERTDYDRQGRVVTQIAFGGDTTTTSYSWNPALATNGLGVFGGWTETTTYGNGRTATEQSDMFGHNLSRTDLGGHQFSFTYDKAGRLTDTRTTNGAITDTISYAYLNTGLVGSISTSGGSTSQTIFGYDSNGNKLSEKFTKNGVELQNATATYDALGRMTSWAEAGNTKTPAANVRYEYDANNNVRRIIANYASITATGGAIAGQSSDYWYLYDSMNRVIRAKGVLSNNQIIRTSSQGLDITYYKDGQRSTTTQSALEEYTYDAGGYLWKVKINGAQKAIFDHDSMGRLYHQVEYITGAGDSTDRAYERNVFFNEKNQDYREAIFIKQSTGDIIATDTTNEFYVNPFDSTTYALGAVVNAKTKNLKNGFDQGNTQLAYGYEWWDGAEQSQTIHTIFAPNNGAALNSARTNFFYNSWGQLDKTTFFNDPRQQEITFDNNMAGEAVRRDENDKDPTKGDPHEVWYRFDGRQIGYTGNNGTFNTDYQASIDNRRRPTSTEPFRFGSSSAYADFDQNYSPINSYNQGSAGGSYTVRSGDTLQSIAAGLWGDSSLWFKIAEANGMTAEGGLIEGQVLTLPTGVINNQHTSETFKPFDPSQVLGDLNPTAPLPQTPRHNKCGVFGQVLLAVIAVAVSLILPAVAPAVFGGFWGGIAAGAVGSIASQGVGVATGIQDKFDWKGVALGAIAAGVAGGISKAVQGIKMFQTMGKFSNFALDTAKGAAASAITQGIGVATGLQSKFSWASVAAAGVGAGVAGAVSSKLGVQAVVDKGVRANGSFGNYAKASLAMSAGAIAGAATKSVIDGSDFGDNLTGGMIGVIASTVGNVLSYRLARPARQKEAEPDSVNALHELGHSPSQSIDGSAGAVGLRISRLFSNAISGGVGEDDGFFMVNASFQQDDGPPKGVRPCKNGEPGCTSWDQLGKGPNATQLESDARKWAKRKLEAQGYPLSDSNIGTVLCTTYGGGNCGDLDLGPPPMMHYRAPTLTDLQNVGILPKPDPYYNQVLPNGLPNPQPLPRDLVGVKFPSSFCDSNINGFGCGSELFIEGLISGHWMDEGNRGKLAESNPARAGKLLNNVVPVWGPIMSVSHASYHFAKKGDADSFGNLVIESAVAAFPMTKAGEALKEEITEFGMAATELSIRAEFEGLSERGPRRTGFGPDGPPQNYPDGLYILGTRKELDATGLNFHTVPASTWWKNTGRYLGPASPQVRDVMLDPKNYIMEIVPPQSFGGTGHIGGH